MTKVTPEWIIGLYDEAGRDGHEHKTADLKEAIKPDVVAVLAERPRDLETEAELLIDAAITPTRKSRRNSLKTQLDYVLDHSIPEDRAYVDPILDWMVSLGSSDGLDKKLRYWDIDDFRGLVFTAYRKAAEETAAAAALDATIQRVINRMTAQGAAVLGDLVP